MQAALTASEESRVHVIKDILHRHPELSWKEFETTRLIKEELTKLDHIELQEGYLPTGAIAVLKGGKPGKTVALRADIDALACTEESGVAHPSEAEGIAHTCGHDFHTASLLGAAMILSRMQKDVPGTVVFIFQPAEETTNGAGKLIEAGLFDRIHMDALFGLHNRPEIETGKVVVKCGALMASKNNFKITLTGVGGHGSMPHKCVDPIVCAAALIQALQTVVSRNTDPLEPCVLSIGSVHGGSLENLVVDRVEMTGSIRCFSPEVMERDMERVQTLIKMTAAAYECGWAFEIKESLPALINPPDMHAIATRAAKAAMGEDAIVESQPSLATEDYSLFMQKVPGFFYWLGVGHKEEPCYSWHNSRFHTDDTALQYGSALLAQSVFSANE